jgi:hypothetical protein
MSKRTPRLLLEDILDSRQIVWQIIQQDLSPFRISVNNIINDY